MVLAVGQEVFVEARMQGGSLAQVGFAQVVESDTEEVVLDLDAQAPAPSRISQAPGQRGETARADQLEPFQRVRLRLSDETGSYFADTRVVRRGTQLVLEQPAQLEVEWQRMYFRLDVRVPFQLTVLGLDATGEPRHLTTRDLSGGGLRFVARDGIEVGRRVEVILQLPHAPAPLRMTSRTPTTQLYTGPVGIRTTYERKSMRPPEPVSEPNLGACLIQTEAHVIRCRMLWTTEDVTHDVGLHFSNINERVRDRLIAFLLDEQRRRKAMGLDEPRTLRPPRVG